MSGLSKLGPGLAAVFVISVVALLTQLCYVLWRRRRFRRQNSAGDPDFPVDPCGRTSKELIYFFCWKNQSRIEPAKTPAFPSGVAPDATPEPYDLMKWKGLNGSSRVLFTIKEEETEDLESEKSSVERKPKKKRVSLEECFEVTGDESEAIVTVDLDRETPFSTPCASPTYYTPSPSPPREVQVSVGNLTDSPGNDYMVDLGVQIELPDNGFPVENKRPFIGLEVHGE